MPAHYFFNPYELQILEKLCQNSSRFGGVPLELNNIRGRPVNEPLERDAERMKSHEHFKIVCCVQYKLFD